VQPTVVCSPKCAPFGRTAVCRRLGVVCVGCARRITIFCSPLLKPISKLSFDALSASGVPAGYSKRINVSLAFAHWLAAWPSVCSPTCVPAPMCRQVCGHALCRTGESATAKFMETDSYFLLERWLT
jgi:hypothetical protein